LALVPTVTASTMIADLNLAGKVRCHNGSVEINDEEKPAMATVAMAAQMNIKTPAQAELGRSTPAS